MGLEVLGALDQPRVWRTGSLLPKFGLRAARVKFVGRLIRLHGLPIWGLAGDVLPLSLSPCMRKLPSATTYLHWLGQFRAEATVQNKAHGSGILSS